MAQRNFFQGTFVLLATAGLLGCSTVGSVLEPDRLDYKSASKVAPTNLEIPPDLTQLQRENRYAIPDLNRGVATASDFKAQQTGQPTPLSNVLVAPKAVADVRIERDANERWLVVNKSPEVLWQQIKDFWQDSGFIINLENPDSGIMETDWAENRLNMPKDFIHKALGSVIDGISDTGLRDKFRTRLERRADGSTEIYISHRGAEEVVVGGDSRSETTRWTSRPSDPTLEADALSRLMIRLGVEADKAKAAIANAKSQPARAKLVKGDNGSYVDDDEEFDRAWRRVGLALDRVGFTVEDRDRAQGMYFVRYVNQDKDANSKDNGIFAKLFASSDDESKLAKRYRIAVKSTGTTSQISVLNNEGQPEVSATSQQILSLLNDQLK
ncbi:MAG TPA: outer membrane protein assembly factor BamC [Burkholderiaceae bacterium]